MSMYVQRGSKAIYVAAFTVGPDSKPQQCAELNLCDCTGTFYTFQHYFVPRYGCCDIAAFVNAYHIEKKNLHGLSPRANYTDRATAACRRSDCQLLRIKGATWSA
jgi:hypothetical protein